MLAPVIALESLDIKSSRKYQHSKRRNNPTKLKYTLPQYVSLNFHKKPSPPRGVFISPNALVISTMPQRTAIVSIKTTGATVNSLTPTVRTLLPIRFVCSGTYFTLYRFIFILQLFTSLAVFIDISNRFISIMPIIDINHCQHVRNRKNGTCFTMIGNSTNRFQPALSAQR
jgi:hypothetical protein